MHNNNLSWYANTDVEISQGPTPHMKDYRPLMILKEGESFPQEQASWWVPEPQAVSTEHTYRTVSLNQ